MTTRLALILMMVGGCSSVAPRAPSGPVAQSVEVAAARNGIERDLMLSIAAVEGGLLLDRVRILQIDDDVPVGGVLELRHGKFNSLARGAELMGTDETALRIDTDLGTEAGARVLAELGRANGGAAGKLNSWQAALEELSGMNDARAREEYAADVLAVLHAGGTFPRAPPAPARRARRTLRARPGSRPAAPTSARSAVPLGNASVDKIVIHDTEGGWDAIGRDAAERRRQVGALHRRRRRLARRAVPSPRPTPPGTPATTSTTSTRSASSTSASQRTRPATRPRSTRRAASSCRASARAGRCRSIARTSSATTRFPTAT